MIGTTYGDGDGSTTFNLPDLRGEFLRGSGNNSHANQGSGDSVGVHQDATKHQFLAIGSNIGVASNKSNFTNRYLDYYELDSVPNRSVNLTTTTTINSTEFYTSRPTNTSVLYIIKY